MLHTTRNWHVVPVTRVELIDRLTRQTCALTAGFLCDEVWWLNDSITEDCPQTYAVLRRDGKTGAWRQLDSFTVSWMARERLAGLLANLAQFTGWPIADPQIQLALTFDTAAAR